MAKLIYEKSYFSALRAGSTLQLFDDGTYRYFSAQGDESAGKHYLLDSESKMLMYRKYSFERWAPFWGLDKIDLAKDAYEEITAHIAEKILLG